MKAKILTFVRGLMNGTPPRFQSYLKSLILLGFLTLGISHVWGESYTITFKENGSSDASSSVSSKQDIIDSGGDYISSVSASNIYKGKTDHGIKGGSGSKKGSITLNWNTTSYAVKPTSIVFKLAMYDSDKSIKVYFNDTYKSLSPTTSMSDYELTSDDISSLNGNTALTSLKVEATNASNNRFYVKSITVNYAAATSRSVTSNLTNCSVTGTAIPATTTTGFSTTISANQGYKLPSTINVTGASHSWDASTGALTISNVTGNVSITITATALVTTAITLFHNNNGQDNGSVSFTTGNSTPDATPTWVVPKENTGWVLTGYFTLPTSTIKVINANNTLNTGASTYVDSNGKWKYTETSLNLYAQWTTTACTKPTNLSQTDVTTTSAILTWDAVAGAASYTVTIIDAGSYINELTGLTTNSASVNDLTSNTEYTWTVKAIGKEGYTDSEESSEKDFTTACSNPITITKGTPSNGSFDLSQIGTVCIDGGNATVNVTKISPAEHYHFKQITATNGSVDNEHKQVTNISNNTTINVEFTEDTKYTITFADNLQHTASIPNTTNNKIDVYSGETFNFPVIADKTAATSGTCKQVHYHFMGWVLSTHEGTIAAGDIKTGTSAAVTDAATYYAVWAKEEL